MYIYIYMDMDIYIYIYICIYFFVFRYVMGPRSRKRKLSSRRSFPDPFCQPRTGFATKSVTKTRFVGHSRCGSDLLFHIPYIRLILRKPPDDKPGVAQMTKRKSGNDKTEVGESPSGLWE